VLRQGSSTVSLTALRPGLRTVRVRYLGSSTVLPSDLTAHSARIG
jgi:hypothetical protein